MEGGKWMIGGVRYVLVADPRFWGGKRVVIMDEPGRSCLSMMGLCWRRSMEKWLGDEMAVRNKYGKPHFEKCRKCVFDHTFCCKDTFVTRPY